MTAKALAALVAATLVVGLLASGVAVAANKRPTLASLVHQTKALPRGAVPRTKKHKLVRIAKHARHAAGKRPCVAVKDLARFRRVLGSAKLRKKAKRRARNRVAALGPASLRATRKLLTRKKTKRCGGGVKPSTRDEPQVKLLSSDTNGMHVKVLLPAVQFVPETGGGQTWTKLTLPDTDTPSVPGTPGIPVVSDKFAVPDGAQVTVDQGSAQSTTLKGVDLFPAQPDPADQAPTPPDFGAPPYATPPFKIDKKSYGQDSLFPPKPASADVLGNYRDLTIGGVQVPAAQYNPSDGTLKVFKSVDFTINFVGGSHTFSPELSSPWEGPARQVASSLFNSKIIGLNQPSLPGSCGEEMLVITNPATHAAADQFATAKRDQGMRTLLAEVGSDSGQIGTTAAEIQKYIRGELTAADCIHPSYVTIMGDDDLVPTSYVTASGGCCDYTGGIPSDLPFAMRDDTDELPDVAVGRLVADNEAELETVVGKIVNYENSPPSGLWLAHATVAADFQDDNVDGQEDRTFVQFAETVRSGLVARGVDVDRVYDDDPTTTPRKFNDGTDLPPALKKPAFAWDGSGADVAADWDQGRFLVVHRDHGASWGWGTPFFYSSQVQALTNGANLPVVLSINCSSGAYDYDEDAFMTEALVNPNGGAVGGFGDTRDSPTWHNSQIALGFADALLPSILPAEGSLTPQRMGNALITGKLRLAGLSSPAADGNSRNELLLWHYFGDPSMQMWGGGRSPLSLVVNEIKPVYHALDGPGSPYEVNVTLPSSLQGQTVSLLRDGQVIGKQIIGPGTTTIRPSFGDGVNIGSLRVAIDADGTLPVSVPVEGVTTLAQSCESRTVYRNDTMVTFGALTPGVPGASVVITYTRPDGTTFERTVQAHEDGNWNDSISPATEDPGGAPEGVWKIRSRYAGDASHSPSSKPDCSVLVVPQGTDMSNTTCPGDVDLGQFVDVFGFISPGGDPKRIVVKWTRPDGTFFEDSMDSLGNGDWADRITPDVAGEWKVQGRFDGDSVHGGSKSPECTFHVNP